MTRLATSTRTMTDPVCGLNVPPGKGALVIHYQGCSYYFCAEACREVFEKDPQKYLDSKLRKRKGWWGRYLDRLKRTTGNKPLKCH